MIIHFGFSLFATTYEYLKPKISKCVFEAVVNIYWMHNYCTIIAKQILWKWILSSTLVAHFVVKNTKSI